MIQLVGPGGAGKSTAGALLAQRLGATFLDLDQEFITKFGDISAFLDAHGYDAYAEWNVSLYSELVTEVEPLAVLALSSGFMTYPPDIHPEYARWRHDIASSPSTCVLLPSLDLEGCVAEIVCRQVTRPFARSAEREGHVIRARFPIYLDIPAKKVVTMGPVAEVVDELVAAAAPQQAAAADRAARANQPESKHGERRSRLSGSR